MIIDTSILIAVLTQESGWERIFTQLKTAPRLSVSAATYVELHVVLLRRFSGDWRIWVDNIFTDLRIRVIAVDEDQAELAANAYRRFGKGRHPARLNYGDCFSYALAMQHAEPLLFKGNDFSQTDVLIATY